MSEPIDIWEVPEQLPRSGQVLKHDGTNESALRIAKWVSEHGYSAFAVPEFSEFPASVRIDRGFLAPIVILQNDACIIYKDDETTGGIDSLPVHKLRKRFRTLNDTTPIGRATSTL